MQIQSVVSSNIKQVAILGGTLHLVFHNSAVYKFTGAGIKEYNDLVSAASVGKQFHTFVKPYFKGVPLNAHETAAFVQHTLIG